MSTLAFGLAGLATSHLHLSNRDFNSQLASDAARSIVADGMAAIVKNQQYGLDGGTNSTLKLEGPEGSRGVLSFDPAEATSLGIPVSVNNFSKTESVEGYKGSVVPAQAAQLVGQGTHRGVTRTVVATIHRPAFPYAVAAGGPIRFEGGVLVTGLKEGAEIDAASLNEENFVPANVGSGSAESQAIFLGPQTTISGDVEAAGGVVLGGASSVNVMGEVLSNQSEVSVPVVDFSQYNDQNSDAQHLSKSIYGGEKLVLEGSVKRVGDLTITNGLELRNTILFVEGNLNISGGLSGVGLVVVSEKTHIQGGANLDTSNLLAVASLGDIELEGSGKDGSFFNGVVYTEGALKADKITIMGSLIAASEKDRVLLKDTRFVEVPGSGKVSFELSNALPNAPLDYSQFPQGRDYHPQVNLDNGFDPGGAVTNDHVGGYNITFEANLSQARGGEIGLRTLLPGGGEGGVKYGPVITAKNAQQLEEQLAEIIKHYPSHSGVSVEERARRGAMALLPDLGVKIPGSSGGPGDPGNPRVITFDPSSFLKFSDSIRLKHWQEL